MLLMNALRTDLNLLGFKVKCGFLYSSPAERCFLSNYCRYQNLSGFWIVNVRKMKSDLLCLGHWILTTFEPAQFDVLTCLT